MVRIRVRIRFGVWLVSCYVFILLSIVISHGHIYSVSVNRSLGIYSR